MSDTPVLPIETERLRLRAFTRGDVEAVLAYRRLPEVARYLADEPLSQEGTADLVKMRVNQTFLMQPSDRLVLAIEHKQSQALIGEVLLILHDRLAGQGEMGYVLNPDWQGQGLATEAATALMDWGFEGFGFHRIYARCHADNTRSWQLMERLGMRREAHFHDHALSKGRWYDELIYALLVDEWATRRSRQGC